MSIVVAFETFMLLLLLSLSLLLAFVAKKRMLTAGVGIDRTKSEAERKPFFLYFRCFSALTNINGGFVLLPEVFQCICSNRYSNQSPARHRGKRFGLTPAMHGQDALSPTIGTQVSSCRRYV